ncbi:MAG: FkbM family methyltransferase, partial [Krumholzibacteria bacterium]|nr:FkbM family methyltransferase [Candidatus Krumholzibacteria bacterium]
MPGLADTLKFIVSHPLNRGRPVQALGRFAWWQMRSRLARGPVVHQWVDGAKFWVRRGETGLTGNIYCGLHDYREMTFILATAGPQDLFVDVGANAGSYTLLACAARGARGVAIEPVPETYARLVANLELNGLGERVLAANVGLADRPGELTFTAGRDCLNHVVADGERVAGPTVRVPVTTLDELLSGVTATLLKIDVEGLETLVVKGGQCTLSDPGLRAVIMELNGSGARYGFTDAALVAQMGRFGFEVLPGYDAEAGRGTGSRMRRWSRR